MSEKSIYAGKILVVNLSTNEITTIPTDPYIPFMGGRAMSARLYWDFVPPECGALDPDNALCMAVALSAGTMSPGGGKMSVSTKSPAALIECYLTSTTGGHIGSELRYAGYDGMVITGKAESPVYLHIDNDTVEILPAKRLWGKGVRDTDYELKNLWGVSTRNMIIGPAGENMNRYAAIISDFSHATGQGGFGAVMGSKNLKAISIRGYKYPVHVARPQELLELSHKWIYEEGPNAEGTIVAGVSGPPLFTDAHSMWPLSEERAASYPESQSIEDRWNPDAPLFSRLKLVDEMERGEVTVKFQGCFCCPGPCHFTARYRDIDVPITPMNQCHQPSVFRPQNMFIGDGKSWGKIEYLWSALCVDYGMSVDVFGVLNGWVNDLVEADVLTEADFNFPFSFNPKNAEDWINQTVVETIIRNVAYKEGGEFYEHVADGVDRCLDWLAETRGEKAAEIRDRFIAYRYYNSGDGMKWPKVGTAVQAMCATTDYKYMHHSPIEHFMTGGFFLDEVPEERATELKDINIKYWGQRLFGTDNTNDYGMQDKTFTGKGDQYVFFQNMEMDMDTMAYCGWGGWPRWQSQWKEDGLGNPGIGADMYNAIIGPDEDRTFESHIEAYTPAVNVMRAIHVREGRRREHDMITPRFFMEKWQTEDDFNQGLTEYYEARGWDPETGIPLRSTLVSLGLEDIANDLEGKYGIPLKD